MNRILVHSWGIAGSVQDGGCTGRAWLGAARGGAVDAGALALANRLVGNAEACAGFESSGGLVLATTVPTMVAFAGAVADIAVDHGTAVGWGSPVVLPAGAVLRVGRLRDGARTYLAVRGGVERTDDGVSIGADPGTPAGAHPAAPVPPTGVVRLWPGPRLDWLAPGTWETMLGAAFTVTSTSRVGARLGGAPLVRARHDELPPEGMVEGAVQVPPDGDPIVMLADHPTTGGYPVVAVVDPADISTVAQAAPGTPLRFRAARPR